MDFYMDYCSPFGLNFTQLFTNFTHFVMEKTMVCTFCSPLKSITFKKNDGTSETIERFDVRFTDGLDSILAETSKAVTAQIKQNPLKVGAAYSCHFKFNVRDFKRDNGEVGTFFNATLMDLGTEYHV